MIKKATAFIIVLAIATAMWIIPSNASDFTNSLFFNVDFNSGTFNDTVGGVEGKEWYWDETIENKDGTKGSATSSTTPVYTEFKDDTDVGRKVLSFHMNSATFYENFDYTKIVSNFTLEVYVKLPEKGAASGWGYIAGTYWNNNPDKGICISYGSHVLANIGVNRKFNVIQGDGSSAYTTFTGSKATGDWIHIVYTHDGVNESYYENGALVATQAVQQQEIPSVTDEPTEGFRIGGYNMVSQFCTEMDCAYVRVYSSAASGDDVKALYEGRNSDAPVPSGNGNNNVASPTDNSSNGNNNTTSGNNNNTTNSNNNSSNKTDNATTFDFGIVALAAVTLSSAVVTKKRKR